MDKLFNLKEWLTVADTAQHLSIVFGEEVTEADVLRLALDGRLKLSVNFVNHALGQPTKFVPWNEWADQIDIERGMAELFGIQFKRTPEHEEMKVPRGENRVVTLTGVWDLPLIGAENLDIEHQYQRLTGGPAITLENFDGTFVEGHGGIMCRIMESFDNNPYQTGSNAQLERIKERIANENIGEKEAEILLTRHKENRKIYLENRESKPRWRDFYPSGGLPSDAVLVVRTDALREFEQAINGPSEKREKPLATIERNSLLTIIAALCDKDAIIHQERGAAARIAALTDEIGANVSEDTVKRALDKIPDALESRKK